MPASSVIALAQLRFFFGIIEELTEEIKVGGLYPTPLPIVGTYTYAQCLKVKIVELAKTLL